MTATISTIIVNYNAGAYLRACIDSLLACPLEIEHHRRRQCLGR
ncbi:hypothetical protein RGU77_17830 [Actimicrobium sp. CCI2.3]|nr:hypothetical protein [Actimicrobium sp. CCI2.3]MDY7576120.1 hypothetical protein [Actimicrobium sp. CCI2.3]